MFREKLKRFTLSLFVIWGMVLMFSWGTAYSPKEWVRTGYEFLRANNMEIPIQLASVLSLVAFILIFFFPSTWPGNEKK